MATIQSNTYLRFDDNVLNDIEIKDFEINFQLNDIKNLSESKTSYSIPIKVPYTLEAVNIFSTLFNVNNISTITDQKIDAKLIYKNKVIINGFLYIDSFDFDYIYVIISRADLNIFEEIKDLNLSDLDFTGSSYTYNQKTRRTRVAEESSFSLSTDSNYKDHHWITFDWWGDAGKFNDKMLGYYRYPSSSCNKIKYVHQHTPVIRVKTVFDKIFAEQGYTYSASTSFLDKIDKLYMTTTAPIENFSEDVESKYFFDEVAPTFLGAYLIYTYDGDRSNSGNTYVYMVQYSGTSINDKGVSTIFDNPSNMLSTYNDYIAFPFRNGYECEIDVNIYGKQITGGTDSSSLFTIEKIIAGNEPLIQWNVGEKVVDIEVNYNVDTENAMIVLQTGTKKFTPENEGPGGLYRVKIENDNVIPYSRTNQSYDDAGIVFRTKNYIYNTGTTYTLNDLLSNNYSQTDFLNDLFTTCNIFIYVDENNKNHLNILTYDDFYTNDVLDWSNKLTINNINISDTSQKTYSEYIFSNILGDDKINKSFNNVYNKILGQEKILNDNKLSIKSIKHIKSTMPNIIFNNNYALPFNNGSINLYGTTVIADIPTLPIGTYNNNYNSSIMFGYLNRFNLGIDGTFAKIYNNYAIDGEYNDNLFGQLFINSTRQEFDLLTLSPYKSTESTYNPQEMADANTFAWINNTEDTFANSLTGGTITNNNLFNNFWFDDLERKLNTQQKFLEVNMYLTEDDVKIENFRKRIWIDNDKLGGAYYNIQKIVFPSDESKLSKVELISDVKFTSTYPSTVNVNLYKYNSDTDSVVKIN